MLAARSCCPRYITTTYVDDVSGTASDTDANEIITIAYTGAFAVRQALGDIGLEFGKSKQVLLCSGKGTLNRARLLLGHETRTPPIAKRLGIDHSHGHRNVVGRAPTTSQRLKKALCRGKRIAGIVRKLPKGTHRRRTVARKFHSGAAVDVAAYGAETNSGQISRV